MPFCLLAHHASLLLPMVHCFMTPSLTLTFLIFHSTETSLHYPSCTTLNWGGPPPIVCEALRDLSGATNLRDDRVGHYLAAWALSCPLARRQFNKAVQYVNTASPPPTLRVRHPRRLLRHTPPPYSLQSPCVS